MRETSSDDRPSRRPPADLVERLFKTRLGEQVLPALLARAIAGVAVAQRGERRHAPFAALIAAANLSYPSWASALKRPSEYAILPSFPITKIVRAKVGTTGCLRSVLGRDVALRIGNEREREVRLLGPARVHRERIVGRRQDDHALAEQRRVLVAELVQLRRAAGRLVGRVEREYDDLATQRGERHRDHSAARVGRGRREIGRNLARRRYDRRRGATSLRLRGGGAGDDDECDSSERASNRREHGRPREGVHRR